MNKTLFVSSAILVSAISSQAAFAAQPETLNKAALKASSQDYVLNYTETVQPRRSALFAMLLDQLANRATLAKLDAASDDNEAILASES